MCLKTSCEYREAVRNEIRVKKDKEKNKSEKDKEENKSEKEKVREKKEKQKKSKNEREKEKKNKGTEKIVSLHARERNVRSTYKLNKSMILLIYKKTYLNEANHNFSLPSTAISFS